MIEEETDVVTIAVMNRDVFLNLVSGMSEWLVKNKMNHVG